MNIKQAVDRGLELKAQAAAIAEELKVIEAHLKDAALNGEQIPLEDEERDGRQYLATGATGIVPVVLTADLIAGSFTEGTPQHARIEAVAGEKINQFYTRKITWSNATHSGKAFRREAAAIFGEKLGAEFVAACVVRDKYGIPRNQIKVEWDRAKAIAQEEAA